MDIMYIILNIYFCNVWKIVLVFGKKWNDIVLFLLFFPIWGGGGARMIVMKACFKLQWYAEASSHSLPMEN